MPLMWPSQIRGETLWRSLSGPLASLVAKHNPILRGWRTSFRVGNFTKKLQTLDRDVQLLPLKWRLARMKRVVIRNHNAWFR